MATSKIKNATHSFSSSEMLVGCWIDGKPLYRKVITGTSITGDANTYAPYNIPNVKDFVNASVMCKFANNDYYRMLNFTFRNVSSDSSWYAGFALDKANGRIVFQCGPNFAQYVSQWWATLEYTKTTD